MFQCYYFVEFSFFSFVFQMSFCQIPHGLKAQSNSYYVWSKLLITGSIREAMFLDVFVTWINFVWLQKHGPFITRNVYSSIEWLIWCFYLYIISRSLGYFLTWWTFKFLTCTVKQYLVIFNKISEQNTYTYF